VRTSGSRRHSHLPRCRAAVTEQNKSRQDSRSREENPTPEVSGHSPRVVPKTKCAPVKGGESGRRSGDVAHVAKADSGAEEDGKRDKARKPKDHGDAVNGEESVLRRGVWQHSWRDSHVDQSENGPDAGKNQKVDFAGRHIAPEAGPPVGDCKERTSARARKYWSRIVASTTALLTIGSHSQNDNRKEGLGAPEAQHNFIIHCGEEYRNFNAPDSG